MKNKMIISDICEYLKKYHNMHDGYFCIYGSYATNSQNETSDIDILYVSNSIQTPFRIGTKYKDVKITVYEISEQILINDSNGKYGGFFCGKMFNPHLVFPYKQSTSDFIDNCVSKFFSKILSEDLCLKNVEFSDDDILKICIKLYMKLYPEYFAYIMRLINISNFEDIWHNWKNKIINSLIKNNIILEREKKYLFFKNIDKERIDKLKISYISRFWIFGAISHDCDHSFYDFYVKKNTKYMSKNIELKIKSEKFLDYNYIFLKEVFE